MFPPKRILMVCEFLDLDLAYQENMLMKYYSMMGHEVLILTGPHGHLFDFYDRHTPKPRRLWTASSEYGRVVHLPYLFNVANKIRPLRSVPKEVRDFRPDLIFIHDVSFNIPFLVRYARRHQIPVLLDYHGDYSNSGRNWVSLKILHGVIRSAVLRIARPHLIRIYPVYPSGQDFLREIYRVRDSEMEVLPLGSDCDLIEELRNNGARETVRSQLGIGPDEIAIFCGGRLNSARRIEVLLKAVVASTDDRLRVVIGGDFPGFEPEYAERTKSLIESLKTRVKFVGWLPPVGVYSHMLACDIAVFPASQSVMWQQAVACGLPLIVGDTGGQSVAYMNGRGNITCLNGEITAAELRCEIEFLANDPGERARRSSDGLLTVRERVVRVG